MALISNSFHIKDFYSSNIRIGDFHFYHSNSCTALYLSLSWLQWRHTWSIYIIGSITCSPSKMNPDTADFCMSLAFHCTAMIRSSYRKRLPWLPVSGMYHVTWKEIGDVVRSYCLEISRPSKEEGGEQTKPLHLIFRQDELHQIQSDKWFSTTGWLTHYAVFNNQGHVHASDSNTRKLHTRNQVVMMPVTVVQHTHYLCTWYSEGLLRHRYVEEQGWGSGEDTGYTPQARWYLKYRRTKFTV